MSSAPGLGRHEAASFGITLVSPAVSESGFPLVLHVHLIALGVLLLWLTSWRFATSTCSYGRHHRSQTDCLDVPHLEESGGDTSAHLCCLHPETSTWRQACCRSSSAHQSSPSCYIPNCRVHSNTPASSCSSPPTTCMSQRQARC